MHPGRDDEIEPSKGIDQLLRRVEAAVDADRRADARIELLRDPGRYRGIVGPVLGRPLAGREERDLGVAVCDQGLHERLDGTAVSLVRRGRVARAVGPVTHRHRDAEPPVGAGGPRGGQRKRAVGNDAQTLAGDAQVGQVAARSLVTQEHQARSRDDRAHRAAVPGLGERTERLCEEHQRAAHG